LALPDVGKKIGRRRHGTDHPHLVVADAERGRGRQVFGALVVELEPLEKSRPPGRGHFAGHSAAKRVDQRIVRIGEGEQLAGGPLPLGADRALTRVSQQRFVGRI
jgi:hypothetical protein